jgi:hypothetical protein
MQRGFPVCTTFSSPELSTVTGWVQKGTFWSFLSTNNNGRGLHDAGNHSLRWKGEDGEPEEGDKEVERSVHGAIAAAYALIDNHTARFTLSTTAVTTASRTFDSASASDPLRADHPNHHLLPLRSAKCAHRPLSQIVHIHPQEEAAQDKEKYRAGELFRCG